MAVRSSDTYFEEGKKRHVVSDQLCFRTLCLWKVRGLEAGFCLGGGTTRGFWGLNFEVGIVLEMSRGSLNVWVEDWKFFSLVIRGPVTNAQLVWPGSSWLLTFSVFREFFRMEKSFFAFSSHAVLRKNIKKLKFGSTVSSWRLFRYISSEAELKTENSNMEKKILQKILQRFSKFRCLENLSATVFIKFGTESMKRSHFFELQ